MLKTNKKVKRNKLFVGFLISILMSNKLYLKNQNNNKKRKEKSNHK